MAFSFRKKCMFKVDTGLLTDFRRWADFSKSIEYILWTPGFGNAKNNLDLGNSDFKTEFWLQIFINLKNWPC